jgi:uncharacterized protein YndB with AHSA1/START domain
MKAQRLVTSMSAPASIEPICKSVIVPLTPDAAFACYTRHIGRWWPLATQSLSGADAVACVIEGEAGGRIFERDARGGEHLWGTVTIWQPPRRLVHSWRPEGVLDNATAIQVTFTAIDPAHTRVDLLHSGWQASDADRHEDYLTGWDRVLHDGYLRHARSLVAV